MRQAPLTAAQAVVVAVAAMEAGMDRTGVLPWFGVGSEGAARAAAITAATEAMAPPKVCLC